MPGKREWIFCVGFFTKINNALEPELFPASLLHVKAVVKTAMRTRERLLYISLQKIDKIRFIKDGALNWGRKKLPLLNQDHYQYCRVEKGHGFAIRTDSRDR